MKNSTFANSLVRVEPADRDALTTIYRMSIDLELIMHKIVTLTNEVSMLRAEVSRLTPPNQYYNTSPTYWDNITQRTTGGKEL